MKFTKADLQKALALYAVTDRYWLKDHSLMEEVRSALEGGVSFVQLREKELSQELFYQEAIALKALCREYGVPFVINDDVALAKLVDSDGVHVGQDDMRAADVRALLGKEKILGVSVQTVEEALFAQQSGADYLGVGAVFPTGSKSDAIEVSHPTLQAICQAVEIPVVAIGGITAGNLSQLAGSGIVGVAVISALFAQPNIKEAASSLKKQIQTILL